MLAPLAFIFCALLSPFFAMVGASTAYLLSWRPNRSTAGWLIVFALALSLMVVSRTIPSLPADDLDEYHEFYLAVQGMGFLELLSFSRFEPILFLIYKAFGFLELTQRGLLFVHAILCSTAYVVAASLVSRKLQLPPWCLVIAFFFFPYELVSNTPRIIFAALLFIMFIYVKSTWRWCWLILGVLSHKFLLFMLLVYWFSLAFAPRRMLITLLPLSTGLLIGVLPLLFSFPLFDRLRYYFVVHEAGGVSIKYLIFAMPFLYVIWSRQFSEVCRREAAFFYALCMVALPLSAYGALGDRVGQPVWMPFIFYLFFVTNLKVDIVSYLSLSAIAVALIFARLLILTDFENHDPFSEHYLFSFYPLFMLKSYLVGI